MSGLISTRKIGQHTVPAIGFGCISLSSFAVNKLPPVPDDERFRVLDAAFEKGCTHWDTSDQYGDSEELLGKWFSRTGKRDRIFLATKFGARGRDSPDNSAEYMRTCIEQSLRKMGTDYIDLFYVHRVDKNMPIETTVRAMAELVKEGKVRYLGLSEAAEGTLRRAHAVHPIAAVQVEYSPFCLEIEDPKVGLLKACRELGITVVAYAPLGKGMLSGLYKCHEDIPATDYRRLLPKFSNENFPNILKLVHVLQGIGKKHNATASQVTLAWLLAQGPEIIPLPGTKTVKYLEDNAGASGVHLSDDDVQQIREVAVQCNGSSIGDRYPAFAMPYLMVDTIPL